MSDNHLHIVSEPGDNVIKGSNFPTPMAIAPGQPTNSADSESQDEESDDAEN